MTANIMPVPGSRADQLREQGNRFFQQKDYHTAVHYYGQSLNEQQTAVVLSNRAQAYLNLNEPLLANKDANAAMDIDPNNEKAHYRYFLSLVHLGKKAEAVIALNEHRQFQQDVHDFKICSFLDQLRTPLWGKCVKNSVKINTLLVFREDSGIIHINAVDSNNKTSSFSSYSDFQQQLANKVQNRVEYVAMTNVKITKEFMQCFSSFNPICWSGEMCIKYTKFTQSQFEVLFGRYFQPYKAYFSGDIGLSSSFFFPAINRLPGLLHCDDLELNDYEMKDRMPMDEVINYLYYQPDVNSFRRRTLFVGIAQLGGMSFDQVFNVLAQKFYDDSLSYMNKWCVHPEDIATFFGNWLTFESRPSSENILGSYKRFCSAESQKMYSDTQPHSFLFGICGDRDQPQQRATNENTLELLMMMKGGRGMEFLRAQRGNYVR